MAMSVTPFAQHYDIEKIVPITPISKKLSSQGMIAVKIKLFGNFNTLPNFTDSTQKVFWLAATTITDENFKNNADQAVFDFKMVADAATFWLQPHRSHHHTSTLLVQ